MLLSALAVAGHLVVFLVAAESVGVELSPLQLLPIGALVLLGSAIPLNVAGLGSARGRRGLGVHGVRLDGGGRADGLGGVRGARHRGHAARAPRPGRPPWLSVPTRCCRAACRSTAILDDASDQRLLLSNDADFDRVDELRAGSDAILVGAATVRNDDPRLQVRCPERVARRRAAGLPAQPLKVTVTNRAKLDADARFFTVGTGPKLVYCASDTVDMATEHLSPVATVVDGGRPVELRRVSEDLHARGVRRLMVEGGGEVHTQFLTEGLADELQLVIAPVFVGHPDATRFVGPGRFPFSGSRRARLVESRPIGDVVLLRYALSARFGDAS